MGPIVNATNLEGAARQAIDEAIGHCRFGSENVGSENGCY